MHIEELSTLTIDMRTNEVDALRHEVKRLNRLYVLLKSEHQKLTEHSNKQDDALYLVHQEVLEEMDRLEAALISERRELEDLQQCDDGSLDEDIAITENRIEEIERQLNKRSDRLRQLYYTGSY